MNRKAELISQPLMYIFIIIVIALILSLGVKLIFDLQETAEQAAQVKFMQDLDLAVNQIYTKDTGSSTEYKSSSSYKGISTAPKAEIICFIDSTQSIDSSNLLAADENNLLKNIKSKNVVIFPIKNHQSLNIDNLKPIENPLCFKLKSPILTNFKLENKGSYVEISGL